MHASVNPFCQVLAQPFLSKLPAWSQSPLCWWEELEEKACGTPAAPRPSPGPSTHEGRAWDLLRAGALCGSCDWRFNRLSLGHPSATLHSLSHLGNGGKKTITHIFSNLPLPVFPQLCVSDLGWVYCYFPDLLKHFSGFCVLQIIPPFKHLANELSRLESPSDILSCVSYRICLSDLFWSDRLLK